VTTATGIVCGGLWLATLLASDASRFAITVVWAVVGLAIGLSVLGTQEAALRSRVAALESALRRNAAIVHRIRGSEVIDVEEPEDEGACWLIQLPEEQVLVLAGQQYYPTPRFPSDDFSLIEILREDGQILDCLLKTEGKKLEPTRTLAANAQRDLLLPGLLPTLKGSLSNVDALLQGARRVTRAA
jgi:hypothetical protein